MFFGCFTYGTIGSSGCLVQALNPASASEAPMIFMKSRRELLSVHSEACLGNSRCSISSNSGVCASSSRVRQYCGPRASLSFSRTSANSSAGGRRAVVGPYPSPLQLVLLAGTHISDSALLHVIHSLRSTRQILRFGFRRTRANSRRAPAQRWQVLQLVMSRGERTLFAFTR